MSCSELILPPSVLAICLQREPICPEDGSVRNYAEVRLLIWPLHSWQYQDICIAAGTLSVCGAQGPGCLSSGYERACSSGIPGAKCPEKDCTFDFFLFPYVSLCFLGGSDGPTVEPAGPRAQEGGLPCGHVHRRRPLCVQLCVLPVPAGMPSSQQHNEPGSRIRERAKTGLHYSGGERAGAQRTEGARDWGG